MKTNETMNFKKIQKLWDSQPFLERLFFLTANLNLTQKEGEKLSKLNFRNLNDNYKVKIYQVLN